MSTRPDGAENLRRSVIRDLCEDLEFVGSCEDTNGISKMCSELEQRLVELAKSEGWSAYKEWPPEDEEVVDVTETDIVPDVNP